VEGPAEKRTEEREMKKLVVLLGMGVLVVIVASGIVQAQKKSVIYVSSSNATFTKAPSGMVSMATLWGDPQKGAHATFTKFEPGYDAGMHSHTSDIWITVIKGAYLYKDEAGEKRVGPGDYLRVEGGHKHWSGGDKTEGALFYEEGSGKFDSIPAE
jgi:quercetin dioxygenase-like cupin family protein